MESPSFQGGASRNPAAIPLADPPAVQGFDDRVIALRRRPEHKRSVLDKSPSGERFAHVRSSFGVDPRMAGKS